MMYLEERECIHCHHPVTYHVINDAHDPETYRQFVTIMIKGKLKGLPATTDNCPKCGQEYSLESTKLRSTPKKSSPTKRSR